MSEKTAVHTPTQESYDILMKAYEKKGWRWCNNLIATDKRENNRHKYKQDTCVVYGDGFSFGDKGNYKNNTIITVEEALVRLGQYEKGQEVLVSHNTTDWEKRIYVTTIEGATIPYVTVANGNEKRFNEGEDFNCCYWYYIKPIEEPIKEMTMQEVEEKLGHRVKIVK